MRNWLACGAPVVERTETPYREAPGSECASNDVVGSCVHRVFLPAVAPEPTFYSLDTEYLEPSCAGCHGPGATDARATSALDLSTADIAFKSLRANAAGARCGGEGAHVVPFDPDALLLLDTLGLNPRCSDPMAGPRGAPVGELEALRAWIAADAPR